MNAWPQGYDRVVLDEVDSTMDEATRRASDLTRPTWIMAKVQTKARGRLGRPWTHPEGNFAASLVLPTNEAIEGSGQHAILAAVVLNVALQECGIEAPRLRNKWPNDVLLDGGKVAGILIETEISGNRLTKMILGVGVNLVSAPPKEDRAAFPPISILEATGKRIAQERFLEKLAGNYARLAHDYHGFGAPLRKHWERQVAHRDVVRIDTGTEVIRGFFVGLNDEGHLGLMTENGLRHFAAGDISFEF